MDQTIASPEKTSAFRATSGLLAETKRNARATYTIGDLVEMAYAHVDRYGTGSDRDAAAARLVGVWLRRARISKLARA